jgi:ribose transport system substrate-binding protein
VSVVVFDAAPLAIADMAAGNIDAMIVQNPYEMGYQGVRLMKALVTDDRATIHEMLKAYDPQKKAFAQDVPDGDILITGLRVVHPDSGSPLTKEMFGPTTEFQSLGEFKQWLAQHKLTGS